MPDPKDGDNRENQLAGKHNVKAISNGNWEFETWMSASLYRPGEPIDLTIQLIHHGDRALGDPLRLKVRVEITQADSRFIQASHFQLTLTRQQERNQRWVATLRNVFRVDKEKDEPLVFPRGNYYILIATIVQDKVELSIDKLPVKVWSYEGH